MRASPRYTATWATHEASTWRIERELGCLDLLVNNAGISRASDPGAPLEQVARSGRFGRASLSEVRAIWDTNVFGVIAVTQAMLPLLRRSPSPRVVNVSSITNSLSWAGDLANLYRAMLGMYAASKTALNAVTVLLAADLEADGIKINAACPGFTKTNLYGFRGTGTVEEGARAGPAGAARRRRADGDVLEQHRANPAVKISAVPCRARRPAAPEIRKMRRGRGSLPQGIAAPPIPTVRGMAGLEPSIDTVWMTNLGRDRPVMLLI